MARFSVALFLLPGYAQFFFIHLRVVKNLRNYRATKPSIIHIHTSGKNISLATHGVRNLFRSSLGRSSLVVKNLREIGMQSQFIVLRVIAFSISNVYISHPVSKVRCDVIAIWINCPWKRVSSDDIFLSLHTSSSFRHSFYHATHMTRGYQPCSRKVQLK